MFRRKEETDFASGNEEAANQTSASSNHSPTESSASASHYNPTPANTPARPVAEPQRPSPAQAYRPTPPSVARMPESARSPISATSTLDKTNKANRRILTVGNDILLKGEIATCDRLVIEGKVDASLNDVHTVEIAETGSFKGTAQIEDAEISGLFEGELVVRNRLVIYASGKVRGKITYGEIEIERGGEMTGEIKTMSSSSASKPGHKQAEAGEKKSAAA